MSKAYDRIDEIQIYKERQPNGQWLKSILFKLPIIDEDMSLSLDNDSHIEVATLLERASNRKCKGVTGDEQKQYLKSLKNSH